MAIESARGIRSQMVGVTEMTKAWKPVNSCPLIMQKQYQFSCANSTVIYVESMMHEQQHPRLTVRDVVQDRVQSGMKILIYTLSDVCSNKISKNDLRLMKSDEDSSSQKWSQCMSAFNLHSFQKAAEGALTGCQKGQNMVVILNNLTLFKLKQKFNLWGMVTVWLTKRYREVQVGFLDGSAPRSFPLINVHNFQNCPTNMAAYVKFASRRQNRWFRKQSVTSPRV